jgi:hypothetical protein
MNNLEKIILDETEDIIKVDLDCSTKNILSKVKVIGVYVQRNDPLEFNKLLNLVLGACLFISHPVKPLSTSSTSTSARPSSSRFL